MSFRLLIVALWIALSSTSVSSTLFAAPSESDEALYERVAPSLVAVQWTWAYEYGRAEYVGAGIVVRDDGLIAIPMEVADPGVPDVQMIEFKIIIPSRDNHDPKEIDAVFQGRDERGDLAFVKPKDASAHKWTSLKFEDAPAGIGQRVRSVGLQLKSSGYRPYFAVGKIGALLRDQVPKVVVTSGDLAAVGGPVFDEAGRAIGYINTQDPAAGLLFATGGEDGEFYGHDLAWVGALEYHPRQFTPARELLPSLNDPPTPEQPLTYPWLGLSLTGVTKDVAEVYGLADQTAIEISDVVPDGPGGKAGLKTGMKILRVNGKPLTRGDKPEQLPQILNRQVQRMKPGEVLTFSVFTEKGQAPEDVKVTLEQRPVRQNELPRFWAEDLGFSVRDVTFHDLYTRKQPVDLKAVMVAVIRPESPAASANLEHELIVQSLNGTPVGNIGQFKTEYEKLRAEKPKEAVVLVALQRNGQTQTIRIEPPQ